MKTLNLLILGLMITGCATGYNPSYYYSNIEVANLSGDTIRDLKVQVGPQGRTLECDEVTKNRICHERFGKRRYPQELVEVNWLADDGQQQVQQVNPSIPLTFGTGQPIRLMLDIGEDGELKAYFKQDILRISGMHSWGL